MVRAIYPADIILPRGDTGTLQINVPYHTDADDIALFVVWDPRFPVRPVWMQQMPLENGTVTLVFGKEIAWRLMPGRYTWDVKLYHDPEYDAAGCVISAATIDSLYSAFRKPKLFITEAR